MRVSIPTILILISILLTSHLLLADNDSNRGVFYSPTLTAVADAGPDQVLTCVTSSVVLGSNNTSAGANYTYSWTDDTGNLVGSDPFVEVTVPGIYSLTVINIQDNTSDTDEVLVLIDIEIPSLNIPMPEIIDCETTVVTLEVGVPGGTNLEFQWLTIDGNIISPADQMNIDVDESGEYILQVTVPSNGCTTTAIVQVEENIDGGNFDIEPIQSSIYPISIIADDFPGNLIFDLAWLPTDGLVPINATTAEISEPGQYTFVATNLETGCDYNYIYTVYNNILADAGSPQVLTCEVTTVTLGGMNSSTGVNIVYNWLDQEENQIGNSSMIQVSETGLYTLQVSDMVTGETIEDQVLVTEDLEIPIFTISTPEPITFEEPISVIDATLYNPDSSDAIFNWTTFDGNIISDPNLEDIEVDIEGTYELAVSNSINGCSATFIVTVAQNFNSDLIALEKIVTTTYPVVLDPSALIQDTSGIVQQPYPTVRSATYEYKWIERQGLEVIDFPVAEASAKGIYAFIERDMTTGFVTRYEYNIESSSIFPVADAGIIIIDCYTDSANLTLGGPNTSCGPEFTYEWADENGIVISTEKQVTVDQIGVYTLTVTNIETGEQASSTTMIEEDLAAPSIFVSHQGEFDCFTDTIRLISDIDIPVEFAQFDWSSDSGMILTDPSIPSILVGDAGQYVLTVTDVRNGCVTAFTYLLDPAVDFFQVQTSIIACEASAILNPCTEILDSTIYSCEGYWDEQDGLSIDTFPIGIADKTGTYTFNFTDANECKLGDVRYNVEVSIPLHIEFTINADNQIEAIVTGGVGGYTYDWNVAVDSSIIENPINGTEYVLTVTDANGCTVTESIFYQSTSYSKIISGVTNVYPNPTDGLLIIQLNQIGGLNVSQIKVFDIRGVALDLEAVVVGNDQIRLDFKSLPPGAYILIVVIDHVNYYHKVIKH